MVAWNCRNVDVVNVEAKQCGCENRVRLFCHGSSSSFSVTLLCQHSPIGVHLAWTKIGRFWSVDKRQMSFSDLVWLSN